MNLTHLSGWGSWTDNFLNTVTPSGQLHHDLSIPWTTLKRMTRDDLDLSKLLEAPIRHVGDSDVLPAYKAHVWWESVLPSNVSMVLKGSPDNVTRCQYIQPPTILIQLYSINLPPLPPTNTWTRFYPSGTPYTYIRKYSKIDVWNEQINNLVKNNL